MATLLWISMCEIIVAIIVSQLFGTTFGRSWSSSRCLCKFIRCDQSFGYTGVLNEIVYMHIRSPPAGGAAGASAGFSIPVTIRNRIYSPLFDQLIF